VTKESRKPLGRRAVIAGGSLGGMLAARAVAPHFTDVLVLERDVFTGTPAPRRTTPQSHHVHMLLKGGENAIDRILPGFRRAIEQSGSVKIRAGLDFLAGSELGFAPRWDAGMELHGQSRWMLEHCLRQRVLESTANVELRAGCTVRGLNFDATTNRVTGVKVETETGTSDLGADLVVDATGRGEGGLRWLSALGVPLPEVEEVSVDFGYSSAIVELQDDPARDWKALAMGNLPRVGARGAVILPIEGGRFICSLGGRAGDYPPDNEADFLEFAKSLPQPTMYETLRGAKFVSGVARMIYPANRFRHYERSQTLPHGLVPVGDALCSFNPTYGQGMTSAALQAEALFDTFGQRTANESLDILTHAYLVRAAEAVRMPWRQANYNDFLYPTTQGNRDMFAPEEMQYRMEIQIAASRDEVLRKLANEVGHLLVPFERLMEADVRARVSAALAQNAS
jgi:2-polyprenyl-6-methoxyphenol hydroxylase-like FAD-dependent oxidoreductase